MSIWKQPVRNTQELRSRHLQLSAGLPYRGKVDFDPHKLEENHPDHADLLYSICLHSTPSACEDAYHASKSRLWAGRFLYDLLEETLESVSLTGHRDRTLKGCHVKPATYRRLPSQGMGALAVLASACAIAHRCKVALTDVVDAYVERCIAEAFYDDNPAFKQNNRLLYEASDTEFRGDGRKVADTLRSANAEALREPADDVFSDVQFSDGLRENLRKFNNELRFLTVDQVKALSEAMRQRRLWIQGAAGTGKTTFLIEVAYRNLRAGHSVLIVYRSRQFERIFGSILQGIGGQLSLLIHLDFMYLLRMIEMHGPESVEFRDTARELLNGVGLDELPLFDLLIIDDVGTFETQMPFLLSHVNQLSHRQMVLAAPEQVLDNIVFSSSHNSGAGSLEPYDVVPQALEAPRRYSVVELTQNVRNSAKVFEYANAYSEHKGIAGVRQAGSVVQAETAWDDVDGSLIEICSGLLRSFSPNQIKILVDPGITNPFTDGLTPEQLEEKAEEIIGDLPPLTQALLIAYREGSFLHSTFECEPGQIEELQSVLEGQHVCFVYSDGEQLGAITSTAIGSALYADALAEQIAEWETPYVDASAILASETLVDPLKITNAIAIYPMPLFIGLEASAIIYVRSKTDVYGDRRHTDHELCDRLERLRNAHHYLAMSRARYALIDLKLS